MNRISGVLARDGRRAADLADAEAHRHAFGERGNVGDDADDPLAAAERLDRARDDVERLGIERAEAFVEEDRFQRGRAVGREVGDAVGEGERERERRLERLAARTGCAPSGSRRR